MFVENNTHFDPMCRSYEFDDGSSIVTTAVFARLQTSERALTPLPTEARSALAEAPAATQTSYRFRGSVHPQQRGATAQDLKLILGDRRVVSLRLFGERRFRADGTFSAPLPLGTTELSAANAFGGTYERLAGEIDGLPHPRLRVTCPQNPEGKGYVPPGFSPLDQPLPNIEFAEDLIRHAGQLTAPAILALSGSCLGAAVRDGNTDALHSSVLHGALPELMSARRTGPTTVEVHGASPAPLSWKVPGSPVRVSVCRHVRYHPVPFHIRDVMVDLDSGEATILYAHVARLEPGAPASDVLIESA